MKKTLATFIMAGTALTVAGCQGMNFDDDSYAVPYSLERTARHEETIPAPEPETVVVVKEETPVVVQEEPVVKAAPTERVFRKAQSK